jgi:hypothetical protein
MGASHKGISVRGWLKLASWTVFGTLGCLAVSFGFNWLAFRGMGPEAMRQGLISATVLPILLAGPLFFFLTLKLRELAIVNHKLNDLASLDGLTGCLNRRAFTALAERRLEEGRRRSWSCASPPTRRRGRLSRGSIDKRLGPGNRGRARRCVEPGSALAGRAESGSRPRAQQVTTLG